MLKKKSGKAAQKFVTQKEIKSQDLKASEKGHLQKRKIYKITLTYRVILPCQEDPNEYGEQRE
jgi:hypothetical protein